MAKERDISDAMTSIEFPRAGINVAEPFDLQPPGTTVDAVNVRAFEPVTLRARGGSRPGLERYLGRLATNGVIQALDMIVDPQAEALTADTEEDLLPDVSYIDDPSTNNLKLRNPGRRVRRGGSGRQPNANVGRQRVVITWNDPADINQGTALDGTQLNATAASTLGFPVSGSFAYTPPSGTVLSTGNNQALRVVFTPTDTGLYTSANKTVHINVVDDNEIEFVNGGGFIDPAFAAFGTRTAHFIFSCTSGNLLVAAAILRDDLSTITVTDSLGNTYTSAGAPAIDGQRRIYVWYCISGASGSNTVTFSTADPLELRFSLIVAEFTHVAAVSPLLEAQPAPGDFSEQVEDPSVSPFPFNFVPVKVRSSKHDLVLGIVGSKSAIVTDFTADTGFEVTTANISGVVDGKDPMQSCMIWGAGLLDSVIKRLSLTAGGSGYSSPPTISFVGGGGSGATATCTLSGDSVDSITLTNGGAGYSSVPTIVFTGDGSGAAAIVVPTVTPRGFFVPEGDAYVDFAISFKQV